MMIFVFIALYATYVAAQYEGYKLIQLQPKYEFQSQALRKLMLNDVELDFWTEPSRLGSPVDVLVPPHKMQFLRSKMSYFNIEFIVRDENIQTSVDEESHRLATKVKKDFDLNDFNDYQTTVDWLDDLPSKCARNLDCTTYSIGTTQEGRRLKVFKMSKSGKRKRGFWLDSTIHAREWLAPATLVNIMNRMVTGFGVDPEVDALLDAYDFYFLPIMNPDGYQYSFDSERLWRKNRSTNQGLPCIGTDLNRNYNHFWGTEGVSKNPCSEIYCGSKGGSELETSAVQDEAARIGNTLDAWITLHSYGQMWMHPWGNTIDHRGKVCERAKDHDEMYAVADAAADAIEKVYDTKWARGVGCEVIYETTGSADDYMKAVHGVKYPVCPELRGKGFIVDPSEIAKSYEEIFAGLVEMAGQLQTAH